MRSAVLACLLVSILFVSGTALAAENSMKTCAKEYHQKNIPKSDYRKFMGECRKRKAEEAKRDPSALAEKTGNSIVKKSRTAACRRAATKQGLHLDLRKIFVGECAGE